MRVDAQGWVSGVDRRLSPNHDKRPSGMPIELIVVHAISLPPACFGGPWIAEFFANRLDPEAHSYFATIVHLHVSSHFLIRRDGYVIQFVGCADRAWHAGVSQWRGRERCNDFSLGIELEGCDTRPFTSAQYLALARLSGLLAMRYPIVDMVGHSDIAPGRKTDPGPFFNWSKLAKLREKFSRRIEKSLA